MLVRQDIEDVTILRFTARRLLDVGEIKTVFEPINQAADEPGRNKLILNFASVEFLSSFVLGKLMVVKKKTEAAGGGMVLCNVAPQLQANFRGPTRMLFDVFESEPAALRFFSVEVAP